MPRAPITLDVKNVDPVVRRLRAYSEETRAAIKDLVGETAAEQYQRTYDLCPKDTYFMADHIVTQFTRQGYGYQMGWREADFRGAQLPFYALFQELGFRHWISGRFIQNPSLRPAWAEISPRFQRALAALLRKGRRKV